MPPLGWASSRMAGPRPSWRRCSAAVTAADSHADSVTSLIWSRPRSSRSTSSSLVIRSRRPSGFSSTMPPARPCPDRCTTSQPAASSRASSSRPRVAPYCSTRSSMALLLTFAMRCTSPARATRSLRRFNAPAPSGRLNTASIRNRSPTSCLSRAVWDSGTITRFVRCPASVRPSTRASSHGNRASAGASAGTSICTGPRRRASSPPIRGPSTCSPTHSPTCSTSSA